MTSGREGQTAGTLVAATGSATRRARVAQRREGHSGAGPIGPRELERSFKPLDALQERRKAFGRIWPGKGA
jgi:hypothetical protein